MRTPNLTPMRKLAAVALVALVALVASGCSKAARPSLGEEVSGQLGAGPTSTTAPAGTTTSVATSTAGGGGTGGQGAPGGVRTGGAAAATATLDAYLDALASESFARAGELSSGGPHFLTEILDLVRRYNAEHEGTTKVTTKKRSFTAGPLRDNAVRYTGEAVLSSRTSGPAGDPITEVRTFANPLLRRGSGWLVTDLTYGGKPLVHFPANDSAEVGGVRFTLQGALSFGEKTGVVVGAEADETHEFSAEEIVLVYPDGTRVPKTLGALIGHRPAALYLNFPRRDDRPAHLEMQIALDNGTPVELTQTVTLTF